MAKRAGKSKHSPREIAFDISELPEDTIEQLLKSLGEPDSAPWSQATAVDELEAAFQAFLDLDDPEEKDESADQILSRLSDRLDRVRVDANGGDPRAREALKSFRMRLDRVIADEEIHPANLIMLGKVLWLAQLPVGDNLREAVVEAIGGDAALALENADSMAKLAVRALEGVEDPFDLYDAAASNMAAFPTKFQIALATSLVAGKSNRFRMAAVGFVLHPDEELARAVIKAFPFSAAPSLAESAVVDRLTRIAPWLPSGRRELAEAAFAAMRTEPVARPAPWNKNVQFLASAHDGSGANTLMACVKTGKRFLSLSVLMKSRGVVEVVEYGDLSRKDMDRVVGMMAASSPVLEIGAEGASELLALALGRNISAGSPPPFRLVQFCEAVGWTELRPDLSSAAQVFEKLLAGSRVTADLAARAPAEIVSSPFVESWFEAGEGVERLLGGAKSRKLATGKILREYLPARRPFWAMLCATSAVAFQASSGPPNEAWKEFALVGREIASETPLERIPLMMQIASRTAAVHFDRP